MIGSCITYIVTISFLSKIFELVEVSLTFNIHSHDTKAVVRGKTQNKSLGLNKN